jgi:hypothetical protein
VFGVPLSIAFTVVFLATGTYSLWRFARTIARPGAPAGARTVELLHLLMSIAMVAMAWGWSGGPATGSGILQLVVFGVFTLVLGGELVIAPGHLHRAACAFHAVMAAAMVWMVATMPVLMGHMSDAGGESADHAGHTGHTAAGNAMTGMAGMDMAAPATTPPSWAVVGTWLVAALVLLSAVPAVAITVRAVRRRPAPDPAAAGPEDVSDAHGGVAVLTRPQAAVEVEAEDGVLPVACHALMGLGMVAMLLVML